MKTLNRSLTAIVLLIAIASNPVLASTVVGSFAGIVYGASVSASSPPFLSNQLTGETVSGTFSYDSDYFVANSVGPNNGTWTSTGAAIPVVFNVSVA